MAQVLSVLRTFESMTGMQVTSMEIVREQQIGQNHGTIAQVRVHGELK